jgi:uncharacterized protein YkwD
MRCSLLVKSAAVLSALVVGVVLLAVPADATTVRDEQAFVRDINNLRSSNGLSPLAVDARLTEVARTFAGKMASAGRIFHNPELAAQAPDVWQKLGENVGVGGNESGLHQAFVDSPGHYKNLVDADFTSVGIGVVYADGKTWVVEMFMKSSGPPVLLSPSRPQPVTSPQDLLSRYRDVLQTHG